MIFVLLVWLLICVLLMQVLKSRLFVDKFTESVQHTFLDYLAGGFELNFMVAIDFTGLSYNLPHLSQKKDALIYMRYQVVVTFRHLQYILINLSDS